MKPRIKYGNRELRGQFEVNGIELDVSVIYDLSPAEPDVNWPGGLDIFGIYYEDQGCVMSQMTDEEIDRVYTAIEDDLQAEAEGYEEI